MDTNKRKPPENDIDAAVSLLDASEYCDHASIAVEEVRVLLKNLSCS